MIKTRILQWCLVSIILLTLASCTNSNGKKMSVSELHIDNTDVTWDGTYFSLKPILSKRVAKLVQDKSPADDKWLLKNLLHKDRFVVCHVILVMSSELSEIDGGTDKWHGLSVDLKSTGETEYIDSERKELHEFWSKIIK